MGQLDPGKEDQWRGLGTISSRNLCSVPSTPFHTLGVLQMLLHLHVRESRQRLAVISAPQLRAPRLQPSISRIHSRPHPGPEETLEENAQCEGQQDGDGIYESDQVTVTDQRWSGWGSWFRGRRISGKAWGQSGPAIYAVCLRHLSPLRYFKSPFTSM